MEEKQCSGLYLILVIAAVLVVASQALLIVPAGQIAVQLSALMGFFGTEALIVCAGCLMAVRSQPLFIWPYDRSQLNSFVGKHFWLLAAYLMALLLAMGALFLAGFSSKAEWRYIILLQNFAWPMASTFPESWIVPIVFFGFSSVWLSYLVLHRRSSAPTVKQLISIVLILICVLILTRIAFTDTVRSLEAWDSGIRHVAIWRLDSFFIGFATGLILPVSRLGLWIMAALGSVGLLFFSVGVGYFGINIDSHQLFWNAFYLPLASLSIAFIIPFIARMNLLNIRPMGEISICIYLTHYSSSVLALRIAGNLKPPIYLVIYLFIVIALGTVLWIISSRFKR